ncbi:hypothetical protein CCR75_005646 [Bremia lactucae]|uniref:glucan endo-1,3-beta-D-glucosidase n=1 Tax=Bremia lactucae TaxID=4779 RepID=A0A976IFI8_BRELC|nr:hypothetical protein CCR75_005646 [Bremia lactucae]
MFGSILISIMLLLSCAQSVVSVPGTNLNVQLPFPMASHPLQLSPKLFAGSERISLNAGVANSSSYSRPILLADLPFPTGAWWTNLVLAQGEATVVSMPYALKIIDEKLHVSYPFRVVMERDIELGFMAQIVVSSQAAQTSSAALMHQVIDFDALSTTVRFSRDQTEEFRVYLVRGSPYITMEFMRSRPLVETWDGLRIDHFTKLEGLKLLNGHSVGFATFAANLSNGQTWYIFASDQLLTLRLNEDGQVTSDVEFTGVLRIALCLDAHVMPYLLESAPVYVVGGEVAHSMSLLDSNQMALEFRWKTSTFAIFHNETDAVTEPENNKLLMLALPHHMDVMQVQTDNRMLQVGKNKALLRLRYTSIRGLMEGVYGAVWHMTESLPAIEWNYADDGLFIEDVSGELSSHKQLRLDMRATVMAALLNQLPIDAEKYTMPMSPDSYNFGKQVSRDARLLLIADKLEQKELKQRLLTKIETEIVVWLEGTNVDHFVYDKTYGGVVTKDGLNNEQADYGNGYYNDHHFHYGYFIYALAAIRKFNPAFIEKHAQACAMIIGDIGTPLHDSNTTFFTDLPVRSMFPATRHKDWFVGHSYASGLFLMETGKSQESSSEGLNAYYALALFSSLDTSVGQEESSYYQYARLLLAMELRSVKKYWHMSANSQIYEPIFSKNAMVGVVGEMSVVYNTWFGDHVVYIHGINMLPFTPFTTQLLDEEYVSREYSILRQDPIGLHENDIWRSIVVMDHAIVDAAKAWNELNRSVKTFDTWSSRSNAMHWIATRSSWLAHKNRSAFGNPASAIDDLCFGSPACASAGENGTALTCCSTLPGCCPSALGCCPLEDPALLPNNACLNEQECAVLGLGCCNSPEGCCVPDKVTGKVLGCCKNQHPVASNTTDKDEGKRTNSMCYGEPLCAAAKLDCCDVPGGCCSASNSELDCCFHAKPFTAHSSASYSSSTNTCQGQPKCGAADLDCCEWDGGCCKPDPATATTLDCCIDVSSNNNRTGSSEESDTTPAASNADYTIVRILVGVGGALVLVAMVYAGGLCYRRRGYSAIDVDTRAIYCAALLCGLAAFFIFLVVTS